MKRSAAAGLLSCIAVMAGCATIVNGPRQQIPVETVPSGVTVTAIGEMRIRSPGVLVLRRDRNYTIIIEKEGFETEEIQLHRCSSGWAFGNIALLPLAFLGLFVDGATECDMEFILDRISVTLRREDHQ